MQLLAQAFCVRGGCFMSGAGIFAEEIMMCALLFALDKPLGEMFMEISHRSFIDDIAEISFHFP